MSATKSGNHIYINGTGNTLASITTDIADTTFIEKTSTSPDIYTVKGNVTRYFRVRNGGELTIGDSTDYSVNETLEFESTVANRLVMYVDTGGRLEQYGDTMIDFMSSTQRSYYTYIYGALYIRGDVTYKPVWQNQQRIYFYETQNNDTYVNDIWDIDGMIVGSASNANYYGFYFNQIGKVRAHIFKNIIFDKSYGNNLAFYAMRFANAQKGFENIVFEDIYFKDVGNYPIYNASGTALHFKNTTIGTTTSWKMLVYGAGNFTGLNTLRDFDYYDDQKRGQWFNYFDGMTFENVANKASVICQYKGIILFKDSDWQTTGGDAIQVLGGAVVMLWTGNTFAVGSGYDLDQDGAILWVYALDLTITDTDSNNIEDAVVVIEQSEGKERYTFRTDSNGKLIQHHDLEVAFLTWKYQYGNSTTTDVELWSDASEPNHHKVTVYKEGFRPYTTTYVMDQDRSATIVLDRIDAHSSVF